MSGVRAIVLTCDFCPWEWEKDKRGRLEYLAIHQNNLMSDLEQAREWARTEHGWARLNGPWAVDACARCAGSTLGAERSELGADL